MAKKRKTRQEKIILQLKRELAKQQAKAVSPSTRSGPRQGAISSQPQIKPDKPTERKKTDIKTFYSYPKLIKKDLIKTTALALAILSFEIVLYLRLR